MPDSGSIEFSERKHRFVYIAMVNKFLSNSKKSFGELLNITDRTPKQLNAGTAARLNEKKPRVITDRLAVNSAKYKTDTKNKAAENESI